MLDRTAEPGRAAAPRQPLFNIPWPIAATLAVLLGIHAVRQVLPEGWDDALFTHLAFVPGRFTFAVAPDRVVGAVVTLAQHGADGYRQAQAERFFLGDGSPEPWTAVSYALLHADWGHVGLNGIWLLAFGTPVSRRFGAWRFFAFLTVGAVAGAAMQWAAQPLDLAPVIGASAAVSACMGATLRFMFQPHVPLAAIVEAVGDRRRRASFQPAQPLREVLRDSRALTFLAAWFATNLLFGLYSSSLGMGGGAIAWQAHIGGFLAGLLLFPAFDPARPGDPAAGEPSLGDLAPSAPADPAADL
ncbi:rhomboid family intramembrane serine protease [Lichenibacterium dinghuense]|uniref:rhomboid family intramembrane serine protease n=1 Tax=Lichenibacterium dinghuense TaxID=2895977 RepID=UPI001F3A1A2D|nr:rhomboid family intramembrane serine protease [Lichenibacterium sp. 6Y81]